MNKKLLLLCSFVFCLAVNVQAARDYVLVNNKKPVAEIILDAGDAAPPTLRFAAEELSNWVERVSGGALPILTAPGSAPFRIYLGTPRYSLAIRALASKQVAKDLEYLAGSDGFAIRVYDGNLYIYSPEIKGVLNGVYRFLELNSDIIFVRAFEGDTGDGTIYSSSPSFRAQATDLLDRPVFLERYWTADAANYRWQARNLGRGEYGMEHLHSAAMFNQLNQVGVEMVMQGGFHSIFPFAETTAAHPEYYPLIGGQRRFREDSQVCFTHPGMIQDYLERLSFIVTNAPARVTRFGVGHGDNWDLCECETCLAPITLPDGQIVSPDDPDFRSTQYFLFVNRLAKGIKKISPKSELAVLSYLWCAYAPRMAVEANVKVTYCPYVKDHKKSVFDERNAIWAEKFANWPERGKNLGLYEYYLCYTAPLFCHPTGDVMAQDLRFYRDRGVKSVYLDVPRDDNPASLIMPGFSNADAYVASAIEYWVASRLMWNPDLDVELLRDEFCRRAYHEAAAPMRAYYKAIRESWTKDPIACRWNEHPIISARQYIVQPGLTEPLRKLLAQAEALAKHPSSKRLIALQRVIFERWMELEKVVDKKLEIEVPCVTTAPEDDFTLTKGSWDKATLIDGFNVIRDGKPATNKTEVLVMHDLHNLYFAFRCQENDIEAVKATGPATPRDQWPRSPYKMEIFIDGDLKPRSGYYHFVFDAHGSQYDELGYDDDWNANWTLKQAFVDDAWVSIVKIPFADIGVKVSLNNKIAMMFSRTDHSTWRGLPPYNVHQFQSLTLKME